MSLPEPKSCRPFAYHLLSAQLPAIETTEGLIRSAVAVAAHEMEIADPRDIEAQIGQLAGRIRRRVTSTRPSAILAHLHGVLFDEEGFAGNPGDYYNPRNSYLPAVLESKRGIPISLVLVYKCVAERVGLPVFGINAPGHFLAEVEMDGRPTLVDPFYGGRILSQDEARQQIIEATGRTPSPLAAAMVEADHADPLLQRATHREWIARMIRNLRTIFGETGRQRDAEAMQELFALLA
ncbi:MAG: transglutaminase-like domain-containing protein [Planctomycetia bacterium]|nr:transglutaminase-like domain-containing protein [Planctomycetia bacterium]